jgi:peptidoglycan/xylan/chitin deacetylase (PgdA/CDA1 family)
MTSLTNEQAFAELYFSKKLIHDVLGVTVTCWRPPYGDVDDRIRFIANELGMKTIIWDHDTFDWEWTQTGVKTVEENYNKLLNTSFDSHGTIVLSHEVSPLPSALSLPLPSPLASR